LPAETGRETARSPGSAIEPPYGLGAECVELGGDGPEPVGRPTGHGLGEPQPWSQLPLLTASVALATVTGFLSMIPSGLFVRDLVLLQLMYPLMGKSAALVGALVLRLVWLVAEVLISGILYLVGPRPAPTEGPALVAAESASIPNAHP